MNYLISILLIAMSSFLHAEILVKSSSNQVGLDETFNLTMTQNNPQNNGGIPDLTPLRKNFNIIGTQRSVSYSIINGQTQSSNTWTIVLQARNAGTITIPPIYIGTDKTTPINIEVSNHTNTKANPSSNDTDNINQDIMLKMHVSDKKPYINQQITLKVTLFNSKQLLDANYQPPTVKNAILIPLEGDKHYQTVKDNVQYLVEEQNYAVFPQKSGPLQINSALFTALVYNFNPQKVSSEDKPIHLDVQAIPKHFSGTTWLPAKKVFLKEHYENTNQALSEGDSLVRTVTLEGTGIPAQLLPKLSFSKSNAFSVYSEKGKETNQIDHGELISRTEIKLTYLFNQSGTVTIPELKLPWFNTVSGQEEIATLPAYELNIKAKPGNTVNTSPNPQYANKAATASNTTSTITNQSTTTTQYGAWILAGLFALAWIITLLLWKSPFRRSKKGLNSIKKSLKHLEQMCKKDNPQQTKEALLIWSRLQWPNQDILNLSDLIRIIGNNIELKKELLVLSQQLYQKDSMRTWHGLKLWQCVSRLNPKTHFKSINNHLPPTNPI